MTKRLALLLVLTTLVCGIGVLGAAAAQDQLQPLPYETAGETRRALAEAQLQGDVARRRAEALEANANSAAATADRTAAEIAALAARIQQSEAEIAISAAHVRLIREQQNLLRAQLAQRQRPLVQLTAALQRLSRRPPILALLRPGSLNEAVYLRAVLETMLPEIARRTAGVRAEIERGRQLQRGAEQANARLRASEVQLNQRRRDLAGIEAHQRLAWAQASGDADREAERALALAEQARDLAGLIGELDKAGALRGQLAALPGPVPRPAQPQAAQVAAPVAADAPAVVAPLRYLLPVSGRLVAGFGEAIPGRPRSRGVSIAARGFAQAVAPGAGRIVFAGPYQGYGNIVIIEHGGGWTSLVTGLGQLEVRIGQQLVAGSPLGQAGPGRPVLTLELRRAGEAVNPLDFLKG
ncbi:MAG: hypothetical protein RLZZ84_539 [Pseudomonadota bacterium]|jgi:septal ring factor EnvC (AmiA/AmiB activator)